MVQILPQVENFASQFAKQLGSGLSEGMGTSPNLVMDLMKMKRERQSSIADRLLQQTEAMAKEEKRTIPIEEKQRLLGQISDIDQSSSNPIEREKQILGLLAQQQNERRMIEENLQPETLGQAIKGAFTGEDKEARKIKRERAIEKISKSKYSDPEKAALLTKKLGYEAAQDIISPLSKEEKQAIEKLPRFQRVHGYQAKPLDEKNKENVKNFLKDIYSKNSSANPITLRSQLEKKGVNWKDFLDIYEGLKSEGLIQLPENSNTADMENHLYRPPMGPLKTLFHNIKLVER